MFHQEGALFARLLLAVIPLLLQLPSSCKSITHVYRIHYTTDAVVL